MTDDPGDPRLKGSRSVLNVGDYVLATRYREGHPRDQWVIGFFTGMQPPDSVGGRFMVADAHHNQFRLDGFQRIKKISAGRGRWILERERLGEIENGGRSVWWWARVRMGKA